MLNGFDGDVTVQTGNTLNSGFSEILELRPVQEEALLHFIKREDVFGCGKSLIFQLVPKVCSYLHDCGFSYPKAAIIVVINFVR